jgi:hypothetical protein
VRAKLDDVRPATATAMLGLTGAFHASIEERPNPLRVQLADSVRIPTGTYYSLDPSPRKASPSMSGTTDRFREELRGVAKALELSLEPKAFACPLNESRKAEAGMSPYQVIVGPQTMFTGGPTGVRLDDVTDRTSSTILVVETSDTGPWTAPHDVAFDRASTLAVCGSCYHGALRAAMADGSVQFIRSTVDHNILWSLMTPNGGEVIDPKRYVSGRCPERSLETPVLSDIGCKKYRPPVKDWGGSAVMTLSQ